LVDENNQPLQPLFFHFLVLSLEEQELVVVGDSVLVRKYSIICSNSGLEGKSTVEWNMNWRRIKKWKGEVHGKLNSAKMHEIAVGIIIIDIMIVAHVCPFVIR
jgi:hypothetical protein